MGDWEDVFGSEGMKEDFAPWDNPCWNDDAEQELLAEGFKTVEEWNKEGKIIKKGEKGIYLRCARINVFHDGQIEPSKQSISYSNHRSEKRHVVCFDAFEDAAKWAKNNPGRVITRSADGNGYVGK